MAYTREQLADFIRLGSGVLLCGKVYLKIEDLPQDEEIQKCYERSSLNERDTFLGLPSEIEIPENGNLISWQNDKWVFQNVLEQATKQKYGIVKLAEIIDDNDTLAATPKIIKDYIEAIMSTLNCTTAAQEIRNATDNNTQLIDQACRLIDDQKGQINQLTSDITVLLQSIISKDTTIAELQAALLDCQNKSDCDANTIALLELSIQRLADANRKLDACLKAIENAAIEVS